MPSLWVTCNIDFPLNNHTRKFKDFAFIRAAANALNELTKLHGITYYDNK